MSARALNWAWAQTPATPTQKLVLAALADRADEDGNCFPSLQWLAQKCAPMSGRTARRAVDELVKQGLIEKLDRRRHADGSLSTWNYRLQVSPRQDDRVNEHQRPPVASGLVATSDRPSGHPWPRVVDQEPSTSRTTDVVLPENAQTLVGEFIDESRSRGSDPPRRVIGQMARTIGELLAEGQSAERVRAGIREMLDRNLHPAALPSAVHTAGLPAPKPRRMAGTVTPEELYAHALSLEDP